MYIGLKNIQQLFISYPNLLTNSDGIHCLTGWTPFIDTPKPYSEHLLYVHEYNDASELDHLNQNIHMLCIVRNNTDLESVALAFPRQVSLLLVCSQNPASVYTLLQNYFNTQCGISLFAQTLLEYLAFENGLQPAIEYSYQVFHNPVFVFDANYNLIAATWTAIEELNLHDSIIANKRFTDEAFKMANRQNHIHNRICKSELPIKAYNDQLGYEQLYCTINTQTDLGHLVVSSINKPFDSVDIELLLILKKYVSQQLKKDSFVRNARGFNHEYFLRDLLDKRITQDRSNFSWMDYVIDDFRGNMYCIVIETSRNTNTISDIHIRNMMESRFSNSKTLIYHGHIITVLTLRGYQTIPEEYIHELTKMCHENGLYAGMSNSFRDIMDFEAFYIQALSAIELGVGHKNEPGLFQYKNFYLEHMINIFTQTESAEAFFHPKMKFLMDYDQKHHSKFAYTLYMYLIHERNLMATANAMGMHRTSLVYRFKKISSLIGDNFDNYYERLYLILSYEMKQVRPV